MFIGIFNAPTIHNEDDYIDFIEEKVLPLEIAGNTTRMNVASCVVDIFTEKAIIAKPIDSKFNSDEKQEVKK